MPRPRPKLDVLEDTMPLPLPYYPAHRATQPAYTTRPLAPGELPVLVDLTWFGKTMTSENGGVIPSRTAHHSIPAESDDSVIL